MVQHHQLRHDRDVTKITFQDGKVVFIGDRVGTEAECCCAGDPCLDCHKVEYTWTFWCNGEQVTYSGSALVYNYEIVCYDDANAVFVDGTGDGRATRINYPDECDEFGGTQPFIRIDCSLDVSTIVFSGPDGPDVVQWDGRFCCGENLGTISDSGFSDYSVTVTKANSGECDCTGYTVVPP